MEFLEIFTTEKGQCKKGCKEILGWNEAAEKACKKACKGANPPPDALAWWEGLPAEIRREYEGGLEQEIFLADIQTPANYTPFYLAGAAIIAALVAVLIFKN